MELKKQSWLILLILSIAEGAHETNSIQNGSSYLIPCEEGWLFFGEKCYKVFGKSRGVTWKSAEVSCEIHQGSLVTIQSKEMQDFLTMFLLLDLKSNAWIGLNDLQLESKHAWADGSIVNFTRWDFGQPTDRMIYRAEDCVEMRYKSPVRIGLWNDVSCDTNLPFICQTFKSEQSIIPDPRFCTGESAGAWKYQNSCYHTVSEEVSWDDAENYCQTALNGHLLTIPDSDTRLFLNDVVLLDFSKDFWIGMKIRDAEKQIWVSNWIVNFENFELDQHSYIRGDRESKRTRNLNGTCAYVKENRAWSSAPCSQKLPFVCEVPHVKHSLKQAPEGWRCPDLSPDWEDLGGDTCYIFETRRQKRWHEADFACSKAGGRLASITSVAETNALRRRLMDGPRIMRIGLHRSLTSDSIFEWADGTLLEYENWKLDVSDTRKACGIIWTEDMKWDTSACFNSNYYICSAKKVPPLPPKINETDLIDNQLMVAKNCSVPSFPQGSNESALIDSQVMVESNCSTLINSIQNTSPYLIPCKEGWFLFGNQCYKVFKKSARRASAKSICADYSGSLVTIQSKKLQDFLTIFLTLDVKSHVWIGLNDIDEERKHVWDDGSTVNYTYWDHKQPSDGRNRDTQEDCVEMEYHNGKIGRWNDVNCYANRPFICQTSKSDQSINHDPRFCTDEDDGAWKYQNSCYHTVHQEMSWDDAEDYCQTVFNGHLLTIIDSNVVLFLSYVLSDFSRESWIGIKIQAPSEPRMPLKWYQKWSSDRDVRFENWETDLTPNMNGTCAYMTEKNLWSNASCFQKLPFVCEVVKPYLKKAPEGWRCPELSQDWVDLGGDSCYIFETKKRDRWHEANFVCMKKGGHLASISSVEELNAIYSRVTDVKETMMIGLRRGLINHNVFEWADGTVFDYENWGFDEPSNPNEACVEIRTPYSMKWKDVHCDNLRPYICSAKKAKDEM